MTSWTALPMYRFVLISIALQIRFICSTWEQDVLLLEPWDWLGLELCVRLWTTLGLEVTRMPSILMPRSLHTKWDTIWELVGSRKLNLVTVCRTRWRSNGILWKLRYVWQVLIRLQYNQKRLCSRLYRSMSSPCISNIFDIGNTEKTLISIQSTIQTAFDFI
jgi:hypothetical protein